MKKKSIFLLIIFLFSINTLYAGTKLHMVLFGNTSDQSIGQSMLVDVSYYDYLSSELKTVLSDDVEVIYHRFLGKECCPSKVNDYLEKLTCHGDIVFFIYTGHGGRSHKDTSKYPRMCLGSHYANEWVGVSDVVGKLKAKGARLQIVIADCCNSYYDRPIKQNVEEFMNQSGTISSSVLKRLFYETEGNVCITAASPGEYGWCNSRDGSFLSYYLISTLKDAGDDMTWQKLFETVSDKTFETTDKMYRNRNITKSQRPVFDVSVALRNIDDDDIGNSNDIIDNNSDNNIDNNDWHRDIDDNRSDNDRNSDIINNHNDYNKRDNNTSTAIFSFLIFLGLGYALLFKFPCFFRMNTSLSFIVKIIGIGFTIKAFLILVEFFK